MVTGVRQRGLWHYPNLKTLGISVHTYYKYGRDPQNPGEPVAKVVMATPMDAEGSSLYSLAGLTRLDDTLQLWMFSERGIP